MNNDKLREIIYILISILFSILAIKLFIWLLPIILIIILAYFIYKKIKNIKVDNNPKWQKTYKETTKTVKKNKKIIIDEEKD